MKPVFRNKDKFQVLPFRDWLRANKPGGSSGYVVEDLDLIIRVYGKLYNSDEIGKFILVELKFNHAWIGVAQKRTFGLIHQLLRLADVNKKRYLGYYVIQYTNEDWDLSEFSVNRVKLTGEEWKSFLDLNIPSRIPDNPF